MFPTAADFPEVAALLKKTTYGVCEEDIGFIKRSFSVLVQLKWGDKPLKVTGPRPNYYT